MAYFRHLPTSSLLVLVLTAPVILGQDSAPRSLQSPAPYTIHKIEFQGQTPYSQSALESAAGLKVGSPMTAEDMQAAAERLISTGAFGDVGATLDGPMKSVTVIFKIQPAEPVHMLRASFDNFAWFSRDEVTAGVMQRVPLYNGFVPEGGTIQDAVQEALQQMLAAKGVSGKVSSQLVAPRPGQPFRIAEYHVVTPDIRMHSLQIAEVPASFQPATDKVVHTLTGAPYNDGLSGGFEERVLADYRNAGYQDAALTGIRTTIASATPERVEVDVAAALRTGEVYHVSKVSWTGSPQMSEQTFESEAKLHAGDVASQQVLEDSLEMLDAAYRNKGYIDVVIDAGPKLDASAHQISYAIKATAGPQYKLRDLNVQGLSPAQRKDFDATWRMHPGDVYNASYVRNFLQSNTAVNSLQGLSASFKVTQEPEAGLLDLSINFFRGTVTH